MTGTVFASALFIGTAIVAGWFVVRFPGAAPSSLMVRAAAPLAASLAIHNIRVDASDSLHLYGTVFGIAFPILVAAWITMFWLMQMLREAVPR
jgi:hypothetical protein